MESSKNLSGRAYIAIGLMLFALFFGAGNLIFPASLGQQAGAMTPYALIGFILTGVGLPLLGILAVAKTGVRNVEELSGRVHPLYGLIYSVILYLIIGPIFATPRTGTVSYEIALRPFLGDTPPVWAEPLFLVAFFAISLFIAIRPSKLVDRIGKVLTPILLLVILILIVASLLHPLGGYGQAIDKYATVGAAVGNGFLDGYNTMDALASLVFSVLVVDFVKMHAASRMVENPDEVARKILEEANKLAGETFLETTPVTSLSGGQSRALMIADTAILSSSPIVLIDEIENAGIDRNKAIELLVSRDKIVLIATHDPLLALRADKRIVIKNGGIYKIIETSDEEKNMLSNLEEIDKIVTGTRAKLRAGELLDSKDFLFLGNE